MLAVIFSISAFLLSWLTYDGAISAGIFGTISFGFGDWQIALIVLFFFISASLVSKDSIATEDSHSVKFRRNGRQVWSNGFWLCLWVMIWFISEQTMFLVASVASIATATADTWATELGTKDKDKTYLITDLSKVKAGTDGAISFKGSAAALLGSALIAALFWLTVDEISVFTLSIITITGFIGCLMDSYLGARFQGNSLKIPFLSSNENGTIVLDNNTVNWLSTGTASVLVLLITLII
ncbi:MAG: DUF92 domain-containing protein [Balneola sp.]